MKTALTLLLVVVFLANAAPVFAIEQRLVGTIEKIEQQHNAATITLRSRNGLRTQVVIRDQLTLGMLKDNRIIIGDEVRVRYDEVSREGRIRR